MNQFLVMVEPESIRDFMVGRMTGAGVNHDTIFMASSNAPRFSSEYGYDPRVYLDIIPYFCEDEENANIMARRLAFRFPGRNVLISRISGIANSQPAVPTVVSVTEKGVVPR